MDAVTNMQLLHLEGLNRYFCKWILVTLRKCFFWLQEQEIYSLKDLTHNRSSYLLKQ